MRAHNSTLQATVVQLQQEILLLQRKLYGNRTERLNTAETQLAMGDLLAHNAALQAALAQQVAEVQAAASASAPPAHPPATATPKGRRRRSAQNLPRVVVEIPSPVHAANQAPRAGFDVSDELARRAASYFVVEKRHVKYRPHDSATEVVVAAARRAQWRVACSTNRR